MMKKIALFALCALSLLSTVSCVATKTVDFTSISVPEEGGLQLTQYTTENEDVVHPSIVEYKSFKGTKSLRWYAAPLIDISPNGEKLAYLGLKNSFHNLYIKQTSGGKATVQRTFNRKINDMAFSPDGKYIAFSEDKGFKRNSFNTRYSDSNIYMINATEGVAVQQLVSSAAIELSPCFAPDNKSVIFAKNEGQNYGIWGFNIESSLLTQYTEGFTPSLHNDGETLIVTRNSKDGDSRGEIWSINLKTGAETIIVSDPEYGFSSPRISPDGKRIVFVGISEENETKPMNLDIFTINVDGTKMLQLTYHAGHDVSPVWGPDNKSIYFLSRRGNFEGKYNVWKMKI